MQVAYLTRTTGNKPVLLLPHTCMPLVAPGTPSSIYLRTFKPKTRHTTRCVTQNGKTLYGTPTGCKVTPLVLRSALQAYKGDASACAFCCENIVCSGCPPHGKRKPAQKHQPKAPFRCMPAAALAAAARRCCHHSDAADRRCSNCMVSAPITSPSSIASIGLWPPPCRRCRLENQRDCATQHRCSAQHCRPVGKTPLHANIRWLEACDRSKATLVYHA